MKKIQVWPDARNRVCLTKVFTELPSSFYIYRENGKIVLEPVVEIPAEEAWLFKPENKHLLEELKKGLKQKGTISRGSFAKYAKKS